MAFAGRELFEPRKDLMQRALQVHSLAHAHGLTVGLQLRLLAKEVPPTTATSALQRRPTSPWQAACGVPHAACNMQHATHAMQHAT
jgi:hypothetical protein